MIYDFDKWAPRLGTQSSKWQHLHEENPVAAGTDINLGIAEMDFVCAEEIVRAIQTRAAQGILGYTMSRDLPYLESICSWMQRRYQLAVKAEQVVYCRGANPALDASVRALSLPGEGVILQPPVFQYFQQAIQRNGRQPVLNNLLQDENGAYRMNFEELEQLAAKPENTLLLLCSPNNPTGTLWSADDLRRMGEICLRHGVKIVSDEVHQEIVRHGLAFYSLAALFPQSEEIITIISLSKGFNLAGLQVCHMIVPSASDRELFAKEFGRQGPTPLEVAATIAAYTETDSWLEQVNQYIDANIRFFDEFMSKELPQIAYESPQATYMAWMNLTTLGLNPEQLMLLLREQAHLRLNDGKSYGETGQGYVRINLATPRFVLAEALERLKNAVQTKIQA